MSTLTITHSSAEGTIVDGTSRDDGSAEILRGAGWRWAPSLRSWIIQRSRDRAPKLWLIEATAAKLREAGFDVEISIDAAPRPAALAEHDRHERALEIADRKHAIAETTRARAEAAAAEAKQISAGIPFGQPILVGHHSEGRHRRDLDRVDRALRRRYEEGQEADLLEDQAQAIEAREAHRENPQTIARRIAQFEVRERTLSRSIDGYTDHLGEAVAAATGIRAAQLTSELEHVRERLTHLRGIRERQLESGTALALGPGVVSKGDLVQYGGAWYSVIRANPKSVSIRSRAGGSWTDTIPYHQLTAHRRADG